LRYQPGCLATASRLEGCGRAYRGRQEALARSHLAKCRESRNVASHSGEALGHGVGGGEHPTSNCGHGRVIARKAHVRSPEGAPRRQNPSVASSYHHLVTYLTFGAISDENFEDELSLPPSR
jgi:hypothetical protein